MIASNEYKLGSVVVVNDVVQEESISLVRSLNTKVDLKIVNISIDSAQENLKKQAEDLEGCNNKIVAREIEIESLENVVLKLEDEIEKNKAFIESARNKNNEDRENVKAHARKLKAATESCKLYDSKVKADQLERARKGEELRNSRSSSAVSAVTNATRNQVLLDLQKVTESGEMLTFKEHETSQQVLEYEKVKEDRRFLEAATELGISLQAKFFESKRELEKLYKDKDSLNVKYNKVSEDLAIKVGALEGLKRHKEVLDALKEKQESSLLERQRTYDEVKGFAARYNIEMIEVDSYTNLATLDTKGNYVVVAKGNVVQVTRLLSNRYFIEESNSKDEVGANFLSSSFRRDLPTYPEDQESGNAVSNDNSSRSTKQEALEDKVILNSIAVGESAVNELVRSFSWYLQHDFRGVVREVPLLRGECSVALFKVGTKENSGSYFSVSKFNEGKVEAEQIKADLYGDCIGIRLTENNVKALEKWYNSFGAVVAMQSCFSNFQLSI